MKKEEMLEKIDDIEQELFDGLLDRFISSEKKDKKQKQKDANYLDKLMTKSFNKIKKLIK